MPRYKALIFDLDGTLTDPREGITRSFAHALTGLGLPVPSLQSLERYIGPPVREVFAELLGTEDDARIGDAIRLYRERFSEVGLFENVPFEGIHQALGALRTRGHELWVCTSKPWAFAERILERFELASFFRATYGPELDGTRSDKRELLGYLLAREGLAPAECVMIGDRLHDARAAHANGTLSLGVLYGFGDQAELTAAGVHALCRAPSELSAAIESLEAR